MPSVTKIYGPPGTGKTEKKSHNPVRCVKIALSHFPREENKVELVPMKKREDIL